MTEPIRIEVAPELEAGYLAAAEALADHAVIIKDPRVRERTPADPMDMAEFATPAYSVEAFVLDAGINVCRTGQLGFSVEWVFVEYPVPHTDPDFAARLAEMLVPAVEPLLATTLEESASAAATIEADGGPDAVYDHVTGDLDNSTVPLTSPAPNPASNTAEPTEAADADAQWQARWDALTTQIAADHANELAQFIDRRAELAQHLGGCDKHNAEQQDEEPKT